MRTRAYFANHRRFLTTLYRVEDAKPTFKPVPDAVRQKATARSLHTRASNKAASAIFDALIHRKEQSC